MFDGFAVLRLYNIYYQLIGLRLCVKLSLHNFTQRAV